MHELSIANSVVELCAERAMGARVLRVRWRSAGCRRDAGRNPLLLRCCAKDTVVEGAALELSKPGLARS